MPNSPKLLNELPESLLLYIFSCLPASDIPSVHRVCTLFHRVTTDYWLWKNNLKKYFPHYLPPLNNEEKVDYRKIFYKAMQSDYSCTQEVGFLEYREQSFSKEQAELFNAAKLGALDLFLKALETYDNIEKLKQLLSLTDQTERTLLHWAGYFNRQNIIDCVFEKLSTLFVVEGIIDHTKEIGGLNYRQLAVLCNQIDIIKSLTNDELEALDSRSKSILELAVPCCHMSLVRYLVEGRGLDLSISSNSGRKPLHYAAAHGNSETLDYVLSNCTVSRADTVTLYAASIECNNAISMQYLLDHDYDLNALESIPHNRGNLKIMFSSKDSALKTALRRGTPALAIMLLANPACNGHLALEEKIYRNPYTFTPEMNLALAQQLFQSVKADYLDDKGNYDTVKKDEFGNTLFHWLAFCNQVDILRSLADKLSNEKNSSRHTPAHLAAICGHIEIIEIFLSNGMDVNTPYDYEATLLHTAAVNGQKELVRYLVAFPGINLNCRNYHYSTPLREACEEGHEEIASILLEAGADVNLTNLHKVTPLIAAAEKGHVNIVKLLLSHPETDVTLKAVNDGTALEFAEHHGHKECAELLKTHQPSNYCIIS